jgi:hypothetical protein
MRALHAASHAVQTRWRNSLSLLAAHLRVDAHPFFLRAAAREPASVFFALCRHHAAAAAAGSTNEYFMFRTLKYSIPF